jgi:GlpG protein
MFGVEPDLLCEGCAEGVRKRLQTRVRPHLPLRTPYVTALVLLASVVATVAFMVAGTETVTLDGVPYLVDREWVRSVMMLDSGIAQGEVWRFVTSMFLHGGILHLAMNGFFLWQMGRLIEVVYGNLGLALLLLGTGLVASVVQWFAQGPAIGLSGALFGLAGFLFAQRRTNALAAAVMTRQFVNSLVAWFVLCVVLSLAGSWRIGNWAHGAGAAWGWLIGLALASPRRKLLVPAVALATVAIVAAMPFVTPFR